MMVSVKSDGNKRKVRHNHWNLLHPRLIASEVTFDRTRELLKRHMPLVHRSTGALCMCGTVVCDLYSLLNVR